MQTYKNLHIIGTSHIAIESIKEVESSIKSLKPDIIALELDKRRFYALISPIKRKLSIFDIGTLGIKGYLFNLIGAWMEKRLGKYVGVMPGSEMKKAIKLAKEINSKIALIDQDINLTLKKLSKRLTWKEKFTFIKEVISSMFLGKNRIKIDLRKVPPEKIIKKLTLEVKEKYPSIYLTLIKERNEYMAKALYKIMSTNKDSKMLAIIGAGHVDDVLKLIKDESNL